VVLNTSAGSNDGGGVELSWTRSGVMVPSIQKVSRVFQMLFVDDPTTEAGQRAERYNEQGSILDAVNEQAKAMNRRLSTRDQQKLDQYFTSVREVENSLQEEKAWLSRPRPKVDMKEPRNGTVTQQLPILFGAEKCTDIVGFKKALLGRRDEFGAASWRSCSSTPSAASWTCSTGRPSGRSSRLRPRMSTTCARWFCCARRVKFSDGNEADRSRDSCIAS
jgi:hypothetical protein